MMQRTQIYLPKDLKTKAERLSNHRGIPLAAFIREALEKELKKASVVSENPLAHLMRVVIKGGPRNLSKDYKKYLYGE